MDVAVPVLVGGEHVAALFAGHVFTRKPLRSDFKRVSRVLARMGIAEDLPRFETAFFATPVLAEEKFKAAVQLLALIAQELGEHASRRMLSNHNGEPAHVARAKEFIRSHLQEPLRLAAVAQHVGVGPFHFCRVFKKATRMSFVEYVSRLRTERVKELLADRSMPIGDAAFAAGFQSIPHFDRIFKRIAGVTPTRYRASLPLFDH